MTQSEREQHMAVVCERDMWRERCERAEAENARLRRRLGDDPKAYGRAAVAAARKLHAVVMSPARHPDVQRLQDVFRGAETRGVFMSILHTLKACGADPAARLESALDAYAADTKTDMFEARFGGLDLSTPKPPRRPLRKLPKAVTG